MHLQKISFYNFRNFEKLELDMEKGFTLLCGDNAQGKSNFIEGLFFLSNLKSFRDSKNVNLIRWGEECCHIGGRILLQSGTAKVEVGIDKKGKSVRVNDKCVKSGKDYFGSFKTVLFAPEELNLVKGGPAGRRALLDRAIFLSEAGYLIRVKKFEKYLKNRNRVLKEQRSQDELDAWSEGFLQAGMVLRRERIDYLRELIPELKNNYEIITGKPEKIDIAYPGFDNDAKELEKKFRADLQKSRERERCAGYTLVGPHWDDPIFLLNGRSLRDFGSQGQKRSFLMAFKISQIKAIERSSGKTPVLLLDDMASELDFLRQVNFFRFLSARQGQVFITTTDKEQLLRCGVSPNRTYRVSGGTLEEVTYERL